MSQPRILISGASVAGPALAYWLVRAGCKVTIIERAPSLRTAGQGIDVRDTARDVIKRMGIFDLIRSKSSQEEGIQLIGPNNKVFARFGVDESGEGNSITSDIEILRGELAKILYDVTKEDVEYVFGDEVESLVERDEAVSVEFKNGTEKKDFDLVVAADGLGSEIRSMIFGKGEANICSLNSYVSYFSIPKDEKAGDTMWSRTHWVPGGRNITLRPDNVGRVRAFITLTAYDATDPRLALLAKAAKEGLGTQKSLVQELFQGGDWEISRILIGMHESDDFYMQHIAQVRLPTWSRGRVTLVGDAGYAPSPFTGMGTSLALIGAYVLAGEVSRQPKNIPAALVEYEKVLRGYVEGIQKLPPGIPWIVNPQNGWGVRVLESVVWGVGVLEKIGVLGVLGKVAGWVRIGGREFELPDYEAFRE